MSKNVIFKLLAILYLLMNIVASQNSSADEYALLAFKSRITFDPNNVLTKNWSQGTPFCNWIGITCGRRHQRVRSLNLANMGIEATIAKEIGELSFLRSLIISNNSFHGFIPAEIGNISQLQEIEMQDNGLNGPIPASLGFLENLQMLNISYNGLTGNIPNRIFNLSSLIEISFVNNSLSGSLPVDIFYNLPNLQKLRVSGNKLSGNIPPSLGTCRNLELLSLSYNQFSGRIPMEIGNLSKLRILYLGGNNLTGNIPNEIGNLSALAYLGVERNDFSGTIPTVIGNLSALVFLALSHNNFKGSIPHGIGNSSTLQYLYLNWNRLTDFGIAKLFTEDQRISITKTLGTIGYMAPEYGSTGLVSTMADVYSYGIMLMEIFTKKKPTDDMFIGEFTIRKWVLESFPDAIMQIVDVDLVNAAEDNIRSKESCFRLIMELALECTTDLPEERLIAKDVLTRLKKIKT